MFLTRFVLPSPEDEHEVKSEFEVETLLNNYYPCDLFPQKDLSEILFDKITIFYGSNGSGKSTLLNLIAQKLQLNRIAPFGSSQLFDSYVQRCSYELGYDEEGFPHRIPDGSRIIASDDIFDYMLITRTNNDDIRENQLEALASKKQLKYGQTVKFEGMKDYEALRLQVMARSRSMSRRKFVERTAGRELIIGSNGETALEYFQTKLKNDKLYCLDEPENSMSPKMQLELVGLLEELARFCGCQLILATHSPFLLSMSNARIYDLDRVPVTTRNWWELENTRAYYNFFKKHSTLFERA